MFNGKKMVHTLYSYQQDVKNKEMTNKKLVSDNVHVFLVMMT